MALTLAAISSVSCGQDSALLPEVQVETGNITFEVSLDQALGSRAGDDADELPKRCLLEVYDGATDNIVGQQQSVSGSTSFTFEVSNLEKGKDYTFVFWADAGEDAFDAASLRAVTAKNGNHIAFSGRTLAKPGGNVSVTLKHAVAKLSVVHSAADMDLAVGDMVIAQFTRQQYSFNALAGNYVPLTTRAESLSETITADKVRGEVLSLYMLAPNDDMKANSDPSMMVSDFKLGCKAKGAESAYEKEIPNVTFKANHRTIIMGNIKNLSLASQVFSISLNTDWGAITPDFGDDNQPAQNTQPESPKEPESPEVPDQPQEPENPDPVPNNPVTPAGSTVTLQSAGTLTTEMIQNALSAGSSLTIAGSMNSADVSIIKEYLKANQNQNVNLDISNTDVTEIPTDAFLECGNLISINLSSKVAKIGSYAFNGTGISEVVAVGATVLEEGAFRDCVNLTKATLGDIKSVDGSIFYRSPNLSEVDLTRCTTVFKNPGSFFSNGQNVVIYVKEELIDSFRSAWSGSNFNITWTAR